MKEIKVLMQQLRNYPSNLFVCPEMKYSLDSEDGLIIVDKDGKQQGFIKTGANDGKVIID